MIFFTLWQKAAQERNQLARDLRAERDAAARLQAQYRSLTDVADLFERQVAALRARNEQLQQELEEANAHLELMTLDNGDLERVNEALRSGLRWFEGSK